MLRRLDMRSISMTYALRAVLLADAATCALMAVLLTVGGGFLMPVLGLPSDLLLYAGIGLLPFAAFLGYLASHREILPATLWAVVAVNLLWTLDSVLLLISGWVEPTAIGYGFVIFQAIGVAVFAALEYLGLGHAFLADARKRFQE